MSHTNNKEIAIEGIVAELDFCLTAYKETEGHEAIHYKNRLLNIVSNGIKATLHQELQKARHDCLLEAIEKIEIARQEHNDARHGDSTDDAYDRACDAINPDLHQSELDQPK